MAKSIYQKNPIYLTTGSITSGLSGVKDERILEVNTYFHQVVIGEKLYKANQKKVFVAPIITLFTNQAYRKSYLKFTENATDESTTRLREILSDDKLRKRHYLLMVEAIGDTCSKYGIQAYNTTVVAYTQEDYLEGGNKYQYYLNINGIKLNNSSFIDLTDLYQEIKNIREIRNTGKQRKAE